MISGDAILFTGGLLDTDNAKTAHGLIRAGTRFDILGVLDEQYGGHSIREFLPDRTGELPIRANITDLLDSVKRKPKYCVLGVAFAGGRLPDCHRQALLDVIGQGINLVSGLHEQLSVDPEFRDVAGDLGVEIIDIRQPRATNELSFWTGEIYTAATPKIAVLGIDCAIGKRTTAQMLVDSCADHGMRAEMIYTGQTGWMQGSRYGFILDATPNDFVSGELERCILACDREAAPDLIVLEGQSSLQNPSGPCGSELLLSGDIQGVILQHVPGREYFEGFEEVGCKLPGIEDEIELIRIFGGRILAVTINASCFESNAAEAYKSQLSTRLGVPVLDPLADDLAPLNAAVSAFMVAEKSATARTSSPRTHPS